MNQRAERPSQKRLQILDADELEALYARPRFTPEERFQYFTLTPPEHDARALLRSVPSQLYFMLQLAYFKAKQLFFSFTFAEVADDVAYLLAHAGLAMPASFAPLNKRTMLHHRQLILNLFRYRLCAAPERQQLVARAQQAARMSSKPIYVFRELLQYLLEQRIVPPGYTVVQELVGKALTEEQQRLITLMQAHLAPHACAAFDTLFADTDGLYTLTRLKHAPKDFSLGEMRQEIRRGDQLRPLYQLARRIVPQLEISNEGIKYYASLVSYSSPTLGVNARQRERGFGGAAPEKNPFPRYKSDRIAILFGLPSPATRPVDRVSLLAVLRRASLSTMSRSSADLFYPHGDAIDRGGQSRRQGAGLRAAPGA